MLTNLTESITMLRRAPRPASTVSDWELGIAAVLLLITVVLTTLIAPSFV